MKKCIKCGKSFVGFRPTQKYCSRQCAGEIHKVEKKQLICKNCGKPFIAPRKKSKICSKKCSNIASRERAIKRNYRHGMRASRFYTIWHGIMLRCLTPNSGSYERYGAKGIKICNRWQKFINFRDDMYDRYLEHSKEFGEKNTTIDRINNKKGYSLSNCRWATWKLQKENSNQFRLRNNKGQYARVAS